MKKGTLTISIINLAILILLCCSQCDNEINTGNEMTFEQREEYNTAVMENSFTGTIVSVFYHGSGIVLAKQLNDEVGFKTTISGQGSGQNQLIITAVRDGYNRDTCIFCILDQDFSSGNSARDFYASDENHDISVLSNCFNPGQRIFIPSSKPLCVDGKIENIFRNFLYHEKFAQKKFNLS